MAKELWLSKGYVLADGSKIRSQIFCGEEWQICDTNGANNILIVMPRLAERWFEAGFLEKSLFETLCVGSNCYQTLMSNKEFMLSPVEGGKSPNSKTDAIAFGQALRDSRTKSRDVSFHDSLYVEQYSRLLPTWTLTPHISDKEVLGTWISGGVAISIDSFRRLGKLVGWMSTKDLADIIVAAGYGRPVDEDIIARYRHDPQVESDTQSEIHAINSELEENQVTAEKKGPKIFVLPGRPQLEEFFNEHIIDIIFNPEKYRVLGIEFPSAIVLYGPPGCGKTFAVERLVEFIDWPSFSVNSNTVGSPYIHESSKKISTIFDQAIDAAPSVIIIDEMEAFLSERQAVGSSALHHVEEVAEFLRRIPEAIERKVLIIAMTNMIEMIDPAILRRGRFDHVIEVGMPSRTEVASLLDSLLSKLPKADDIKTDLLLDALTERPMSDLAFVIKEAARLAAKGGKKKIDQESLDSAIRNLPDKKQSKQIGFRRDQ